MLRVLLIPCLLFCLSLPAIAQDSARAEPTDDYRFVTNVIFQFDNRNERYYGVRSRMNGLKLGVELEDIFRMGIGFYNNNAFYSFEPPNASDSLGQSIRFSYTTIFMEWVLFQTYRWEIAAPMALGRGRFLLNNFDRSAGLPEFIGTDTIKRNPLIDIGVTAHYKVLPWIGVGAGVGYRQLIIEEDLYREPFSTPYLTFKVKVFLGYIYKGIFKPDLAKKEREEHFQRKANR